MGTDEMSRAYSRDYELKDHCDTASRELQWILENDPRMVKTRRDELHRALTLLRDESAHITRVWD